VTAINAQGFTYVDQCNGAQILFDKVNATGGINGRQIDYVGCRDDGATTDKDTAETRRLIEQDKVFAIVPASIVFTGSDVAAKAGIPYFGWGISPYFCNNDQGFGFNGCTGPTTDQWVSTSSANLIKTMAPDAETIGTIHHDIPPGRVNGAAIDKGLKAAGYEVVYDDGSVPLTGVADWTPYVQKIVEADPDVFFSELSYTVPLAAALKAAGYDGIIMDAVSYNPKLLQDAASAQALEGMYMTTNQAPYESSNPGIKQMVADVEQYGDEDQALTSELAQGYFAAAMFVDIATKAGKDLTYESFYDVANGGSYCFDGGGALGKACFPKAHTDVVPCNGLVTVTDKKFVSKLDITCAQPGPGSSGSTPGA
jgi:branched-chain amino acid transport system substrate-binding protein